MASGEAAPVPEKQFMQFGILIAATLNEIANAMNSVAILQLSCCRNTALEYTPQHFALLSNSSTAAHATCTNCRIAQWDL